MELDVGLLFPSKWYDQEVGASSRFRLQSKGQCRHRKDRVWDIRLTFEVVPHFSRLGVIVSGSELERQRLAQDVSSL